MWVGNAASLDTTSFAPNEIVTLKGPNVSVAKVTVTDSGGATQPASLSDASAGQLNLVLPGNLANGPATVNGTGPDQRGSAAGEPAGRGELGLQPLCHEVAVIDPVAGILVEGDGAGVLEGDFETDRFQGMGPAELIGEGEGLAAETLAAPGGGDEQFVEQGKAAVEFQAVANGEDDVTGRVAIGTNEPEAATLGVSQQVLERAAGARLVEFDAGVQLGHEGDGRFDIVRGGRHEGGKHDPPIIGKVPRKIPLLVWAVVPLAYLLYFHGLGSVGMLGVDEPRYASVARAMAQSGDWVTPRLWGQAWFEKPALSYWMSATAFRVGLPPDLAPRLPVALLSAAFLVFYWWILRREFGCRAAWMATLILGTMGIWLGYSQVGVTDIPLAATFSAAMLLCLPWVGRGDGRWLPAAAGMLGLAALAKGLVPLALAVPLLWWVRRRGVRLPVLIRSAAVFLAVALPWYLLCYWRNGWPFLEDFIVKQHFARITSSSLMHVQPWWFYLKWLPAELLPWTPLLAMLPRRSLYRDPRRQFLLALALFGLLVFSISVNKLPGYVLPVVPAIAALMGVALDEEAGGAGKAEWWLPACGLVLVAFPIAAAVLPEALSGGLSRAARPRFQIVWLLAAAPGIAAWLLETRGKRLAAVFGVAAGVGIGVFYLKVSVVPELNQTVSARDLWEQISGRAGGVCLDGLDRSWRYGLNYYSITPLPECSVTPTAWWVRQEAGKPPHLAPAPRIPDAAARGTVDPPSHNVVTSTLRN